MPYDIKPESNCEDALSQSDELLRPLQPEECRLVGHETSHLKPTTAPPELTAAGTDSRSVAAMRR